MTPATAPDELSDVKRRLLERLRRGDTAPAGPRPAAVAKRATGTAPPLSPEQANVWVHAAMASHEPLYNEPITIHYRGALDLQALELSFNEVLLRHEMWRTAFDIIDGDVRQIVHEELRVRLDLIDLSTLPAEQRQTEAVRVATEQAREPFDLTKVPLFRAKLLRLEEQQHQLCLTLHHLIFDGVSIYHILMPELAAAYQTLTSGRRPAAAEPALQYGDYAAWRARGARAADLDRQMTYWRKQLAGLPTLQLPTDRPRPPICTYRGSMETFSLSSELSEALKTLSRQQAATPYMTLLAAFQTVLHRYTGQDEIVVGGAVDTRTRAELKPLMGYFLNAVVLRTRTVDDMSFRALLAETRRTVAEAVSNSDVPFDRIVRELHPARDASRHPLFQVLFSMEPPVAPFTDGWDLTQMEVTVGVAKFDLYLELDERPEGIIGRFLYSTDLFDAATIRRLVGHYLTVLEAVVADPDCALAALPLLTRAESRQLLTEWNDTRTDYRQRTLPEWLAEQVHALSDAVAIEHEGQRWTYGDLDVRATRIARHLGTVGVTKGTLVAIYVDRSPGAIAGLLGILKAGGAYLPLDPSLPQARLELILDNARPAVLLTQRGLAAALPASTARVLFCEECDGDVPAGALVDPAPDDLAYVLYTSGSTGTPKGVEVSHRALVNLLESMRREPGFSADDALLAVTTFSFDIAALELFLPLVAGGRVILASREVAADPFRLAELMQRSGCTVMQATPATWRALIETGWAGTPGLTILCGGEALTRDLADQLLTRGASVWNMYGPTETTIWSSVFRVEPGTDPVPIGRPIANTGMYVLDARRTPVPAGVPGDLYISGDGLARGYRGREDLTRERFVMSPAVPGVRLYHTGDRARRRSDGVIEFLGRVDRQVKIRGFRVELGEVETALERHPAIAVAAVRAWPDSSGDASLAAYLVARDEAPDTSALRQHLRRLLPDYMVPPHFVWMTALPLTPNGKVDHRALPEPESSAPPAEPVPASSETERQLAAIWQEALNVPRLGMLDNFFDLGGHSLLIAKVLRRIEAELGVRLPMAALFHAPNVRQLAGLLGDPLRVTQLPPTMPWQARGSRPPLLWLDGGPAFRALAQAIGPDQPFLGIELPPAELQQVSQGARVADIARLFVRLVRAVQPEGPYYIGGFCARGILAYEVAAQLTAEGSHVGLVILLHTANPVHVRRISALALLLSKFKYHVGHVSRMRPRDGCAYLVARSRVALARRRARDRRRPGDQQPRFGEIIEQAAFAYEPSPYDGDVALFQPTDTLDVYDYRPGWTGIVKGELSSHTLPGDHTSMLDEPHVGALGAAVRAALLRAQAGGSHRLPAAA